MENLIIQKLELIEKLLNEQNLQAKDVFNLKEAASYLDISESHLYKLTSAKAIPHFCPQGKKLYFKKSELREWLLRNRSATLVEIEEKAASFKLGKGGKNV